jgi:hypothetical protein
MKIDMKSIDITWTIERCEFTEAGKYELRKLFFSVFGYEIPN